jgi:hypothetical protein
VSFFPDETHQSIRRNYSPAPSFESVFCGYCGTQLWRWDTTDQEADRWVCVTVGSLLDGEVERYFGSEAEPEEFLEKGGEVGARLRGAEWFEDLLGGTSSGPLGRISRLGVRETGQGRVVEWEIVEWREGEEIPAGKRKAVRLEE